MTKEALYRIGDVYDTAFTHLKSHVENCESCAWLGDACGERDKLIEAFLAARTRAKKARTDKAKNMR